MTVKMFGSHAKNTIMGELIAGATIKATAQKWHCSTDTISRIKKAYYRANPAPMPMDVGVAKILHDAIPKTPADAIAKLKARVKAIDNNRKTMARAKEAMDRFDKVKEVMTPKPELIWTMGANFINIIEAGQTYVANSTHPNFDKAKQAIFDGNIETALNLINIKLGISKYSQGKIRIENEEVFYADIKMDTGLTVRIIEAMAEGKEFKHLVNFFENLMLNPSRRAVYELFGFLQHNDIELTDDGHFMAWKRVNENYTDMYTGKIDNSPGKIVEVERNQVDEDSNQTCSAGLHVAAKSYLPAYGGGRGVIVQCKVNPCDVVAIPTDYNNAKMRCCRYEVIKDVTDGFSHY